MKHLLPVIALVSIIATPLAAAADGSAPEAIAVPAAPTAAAAPADDSASAGAQLADAMLRIPLVGVSLASTGLYIGTSPLTFLMNVDQETADALMRAPWKFTAGRPLGKF